MKITLPKGLLENLTIGVEEGSRDDQGILNSDKALWLELGTLRSPKRPFMSIAMQLLENDSEFKNLLVIDPEKAGKYAVTKVQEVMETFPFERLAQSTIDARKRQGNNSTQPTVDTGSLKNSITYEVETT